MTTREEWRSRTNDPAFVDKLFAAVDQVVLPATAALDSGQTLEPTMTAKLASMARRVREIGSGVRQKMQPSAEDASILERAAAQVDLTEEIARSIDELVTPDASAIFLECAESIAAEIIAVDGDVADAIRLASEIVDTLATMEAAERRVILARSWPPLAIVTVLQQAVGVERLVLAADLLAARGGAADLTLVVGEVMAFAVREAVDADAVLIGDGVPNALLGAIGGSAAVAAYAALLQADKTRLLRTPVPALLSCPIAMLHAAAASRFDVVTATVLARAALLQRGLVAALDPSLLSALHSPDPTFEDDLDEYVAQVVSAGHVAASIVEDGEDPDELIIQRGAALANAGALEAYFREPTPDDPLGTFPRVTVTALGSAVLAARAGRPTDYDWELLAELEETRPDDYLLLLEDERMEIMDLVL